MHTPPLHKCIRTPLFSYKNIYKLYVYLKHKKFVNNYSVVYYSIQMKFTLKILGEVI